MRNTKRQEQHPTVQQGHDLHAPVTPTDHRRGAGLDRTAQELGLDMAMFRSALNQEIYRQRIREQEDGAVRSRLRGSPGFFVNGKVCDVSGGMHELANTVAALATVGAGLRTTA
jgi:hypothetical protein